MKATVIKRTLNLGFLNTYLEIKDRIQQNGFLLLHEINTQKIVSKYGIIIPELIQFLFFEPKYIDQIIDEDPLAINDVPLKIVIRDLGDDTTEVSFQNPVMDMEDYDLEQVMLEELRERIDQILNFY